MTEADRIKGRQEARRFRIWCYAESVGWDCNASDIADALGMPVHTVTSVCNDRGWNRYLRKDRPISRKFGEFSMDGRYFAEINIAAQYREVRLDE